MNAPKLILFDVNETLLDLGPAKQAIAQLFDGRADLARLWFSAVLHYSLVESLTRSISTFEEIGSAVIEMIAGQIDKPLDPARVRRVFSESMSTLEPHDDVPVGLQALSDHGYRIAALTNSSKEPIDTLFTRVGIGKYFESIYSAQDTKHYKPHPAAYTQVLEDTKLQPDEIMMAASHAWDLMGARQVGLQTAFLARPNMHFYPNAEPPDHSVGDLIELSRLLAREEQALTKR